MLRLEQDLLPLPHKKLCCQIWAKEGDHEGNNWGWHWPQKGGATPQGIICSHSNSTNFVVKFGPRRETMNAFDSSRHIYWSFFQLVIDQSFKLIEKTSQDKEEVFEGGWSGVPTPSTTANKNFFFIMWSFLYKLKVWSVTSWRKTGMSMMLNQRRDTEADTDPMKEVLCLGATFAPTQQIMLSNLVQGGKPWRRSLRLTPWRRCYSRLLPLPHNKQCCQIWAKEGDHEGDHWGWHWSHEGGTPWGNICFHSGSTNYFVKFGLRRETMKAFDSSNRIYWSFWPCSQCGSTTWNTYSDHLKNSTMVMNEDFSDVILVTEDKKQMRVQHHAHHCLPSTSNLSKLKASQECFTR